MTKDEALRLALEVLADLGMKHYENTGEVLYKNTYTAIKAALEAKDEPDYKALWQQMCERCDELDKKLAQRKPLTDEEIGAILEDVNAYGTRLYTFARAIEAAHGIKEEA